MTCVFSPTDLEGDDSVSAVVKLVRDLMAIHFGSQSSRTHLSHRNVFCGSGKLALVDFSSKVPESSTEDATFLRDDMINPGASLSETSRRQEE